MHKHMKVHKHITKNQGNDITQKPPYNYNLDEYYPCLSALWSTLVTRLNNYINHQPTMHPATRVKEDIIKPSSDGQLTKATTCLARLGAKFRAFKGTSYLKLLGVHRRDEISTVNSTATKPYARKDFNKNYSYPSNRRTAPPNTQGIIPHPRFSPHHPRRKIYPNSIRRRAMMCGVSCTGAAHTRTGTRTQLLGSIIIMSNSCQ